MKIALVAQHAMPIPGDGAQQGGEDIRLGELSRSLAAKGHRVTVYAQQLSASLPAKAELHPGVRVEYIGPAGPNEESELLARVPQFSHPRRVTYGSRWCSHSTRSVSPSAGTESFRRLRAPSASGSNPRSAAASAPWWPGVPTRSRTSLGSVSPAGRSRSSRAAWTPASSPRKARWPTAPPGHGW